MRGPEHLGLPPLLVVPVVGRQVQPAVAGSGLELRHSPFIFWIKDLSEMDPYYITPIVMGASYFLQQKLTPTSMDPTTEDHAPHAHNLYRDPSQLPAGLVLYFFVSNLLSIAQQLNMNKFVKD